MQQKKIYTLLSLAVLLGIGLSFSACVSIPKGAQAVSPFNQAKYLGKWYEIARFDFKFEKDLNQVTANYSLNDDGSIRVQNRGYHVVDKVWKESIGKAKVLDKAKNEARLKVSFFGPFYSGYNVIAIDKDYKYALVAGNSLKYMWILSREKSIPEDIKTQYLTQARALGYNTDELIWTEQK